MEKDIVNIESYISAGVEEDLIVEESYKVVDCKRESIGSLILKTLEYTLILLLISVIIFKATGIINIYLVNGPSMEPNLVNGDVVFCSKILDYERGDIVCANLAIESTEKLLLVKRVIGLPQDELVFYKDKIVVNGKALSERYTLDKNNYYSDFLEGKEYRVVKVPKDKAFLMGDNRGRSEDSRSELVGMVDLGDIEGKVFYVARIKN